MTQVVTKKFPALLKKCEKFPEECEQIKESAKDEIDKLDFVKKGQAVVAMAMSIKNLIGVPGIFKSIFENIKKNLIEIKDTVMGLKD